jgi:hypothetical protein
MAGATVTAGTIINTPRSVHEGNFSIYMKYECNGTTISASDNIVMGYIPSNVTVLDGYIWGSIASAGTFKVGTSASISALSTTISMTAGGVTRFLGIPRQFSLSADAEGNLSKIGIMVKCVAGTTTVTGSLNMILICAKDVTV